MKAVERPGRALLGLRCLPPLGGLVCIAAVHAEVTFEPSVSVGVVHTDNLAIVAENPEAETVYEVIPAFSLRQNSPRLKSDVHYSAEGYHYVNRSDSSVYQIYNANFTSALDPDNFFLEFGASRDQTIRNPEAPIPSSNLAITANRVDRDDYYAGPTFQYRIGSDATVHGSYRRTRTHYDQGAPGAALLIPEFDSDATGFSVDNYRKEHGFTWAASYTDNKTDFGAPIPTWEFRHAAVEVGSWVGNGGTRVFASAGKESPWDDPFDPSLRDNFWEVGFTKRAGKNFSADLAFGERSFGRSKRASVDYTFQRGGTRLSYTEQPATQGRQATDYLTRDYLTRDYLTRPGAAERFISKRFDWSFNHRLRRTEISLSIFDETRDQRTTIDGTPLPDEAQSGGLFLATWHVGVRTGFHVGVDTLHWEFGTTNQDLRTARIGASRTLGPRTDLSLDLSRTNSRNATVQGYKADLISLLLTRKL